MPKVSKTGAPHWSSKGTVPLDSKTRIALKEKEKSLEHGLNQYLILIEIDIESNITKQEIKLNLWFAKLSRCMRNKLQTNLS